MFDPLPPADEAALAQLRQAALATSQTVQTLHLKAEQALRVAKHELETQARQLAASVALVRATLEATPDGVVAVDRQGRIAIHNKRFVSTWQLPPAMMERGVQAEVVAHMAGQVIDTVQFLEMVEQSRCHPEIESLDTVALRDGRTLERISAPQRIDGVCVGVVMHWRDITERLRAEAALAAQQVAERANRSKNEFLARMSHELRTPLNAIIGFSDTLLLDETLAGTARGHRHLQHIRDAGGNLLLLIDDVLDVARLEAGLIAISLEDLDAAALVREAVAQMQPQADASGVQLRFVHDEATTAGLHADRARTRQVLLNLLSNAIKYNHRGGCVTVQVHRQVRPGPARPKAASPCATTGWA